MNRRPAVLGALSVIAFAFLLTACAQATIGTTEIADTVENRVIWDKVMAYREAMEARDPAAVSQLLSRRYYENAATTDRDSDDYGYDTLIAKVLPLLRENILAVQLRINMRRIAIDGDRAWADYEYFVNFRYVEGGKEGWRQLNDFNRLEFVHEDGEWKIVAGL